MGVVIGFGKSKSYRALLEENACSKPALGKCCYPRSQLVAAYLDLLACSPKSALSFEGVASGQNPGVKVEG